MPGRGRQSQGGHGVRVRACETSQVGKSRETKQPGGCRAGGEKGGCGVMATGSAVKLGVEGRPALDVPKAAESYAFVGELYVREPYQ